MSDNQSWNSSGSEEDVEPRDESGHLVGIVDLSGVLSKVNHLFFPSLFSLFFFNTSSIQFHLKWFIVACQSAAGHNCQGGVCLRTRVEPRAGK